MSFPFDDDFSLSSNKRISCGLTQVAGYVNPQYTDKRYVGFMTPEPSPTDATPRRESFPSYENRSTYFSDSSAASSFMSQSGCGTPTSSAASSFMSHSGCGTPTSSAPGSSASNSRRQSMLLSDSQQCYSLAISPSPSTRSQKQKRAAAADQCLMQESSPGSHIVSTDTASLITDGVAVCTPEDEFTMVVDDYSEKYPRQWQNYCSQTDTSSLYGRAAQSVQSQESVIWGRDLAAEIAAQASNPLEFSQPLFGFTQPTIFESTTPRPDADAYDAVGSPIATTTSLAPAIECYQHRYDTNIEFANEDGVSTAARARRSGFGHVFRRLPPKGYISPPPLSADDSECDNATSPVVKNRYSRQKQYRVRPDKIVSKHKSHRCLFENCNYACNRPEHLRRHQQSIHMEENVEMLPCAFRGCTNRKTGSHREIIARMDNLKAHYTKTHFKYGSSEKGGKNDRKSMKAAYKMGLNVYDHRWTLLLEGKMNINHEIKDSLHVWKMLGYSILETRDTKVKDVVPDWQGPENETLQKFDPRWKALWDGTLTFDKAMNVGKDMKESAAQGLLGVTMSETEAMGIQHLDPRWTEMLSGGMSVEQSEKLGVKQRNPVWKDLRRRAR